MTNSQREIKDLLLKLFWRLNAIQPPVNQSAPNEAPSVCLSSAGKYEEREQKRGGGGGQFCRDIQACAKRQKREPGFTQSAI